MDEVVDEKGRGEEKAATSVFSVNAPKFIPETKKKDQLLPDASPID